MFSVPAFREWSGRTGACLLLALVALGGNTLQGHALEILPRSFSRTRQFVVYAKDSAVRNAVGTLGDDAKGELLRALGLNDEWKLPIVVDIRAPEPGMPDARPPIQLTLAQTGLGLKIELDLVLGETSHGTRIRGRTRPRAAAGNGLPRPPRADGRRRVYPAAALAGRRLFGLRRKRGNRRVGQHVCGVAPGEPGSIDFGFSDPRPGEDGFHVPRPFTALTPTIWSACC